MQYHNHNRRKYLLLFHVIFVVKYRKKVLKNDLAETVKLSVLDCAKASSFDVPEMEVDQDHLHMMIDLSPNYSISQLVRRLKQTTNNALWERHGRYLRRQFWLERTFWSDGYFAATNELSFMRTFKLFSSTFEIRDRAYIPATHGDHWVLRP